MSGEPGAGPPAGDERRLPEEQGVVPGVPGAAGDATPSFAAPPDAGPGIPGPLGSTLIAGRPFAWGARTFVMGIINVTPDSFSGDGLLGASSAAAPADPGASGRLPGTATSARPWPWRPGWSPRARTSSTSVASRRGRATVRSTRPRSCAGSSPSSRRSGRPIPGCRSASTRRSRSWPRPRSMPGPVSSTTSGAWPRTTRSPGSPPSAACRSSSCTTGPRPATRTSWPRSWPTWSGRSSAPSGPAAGSRT